MMNAAIIMMLSILALTFVGCEKGSIKNEPSKRPAAAELALEDTPAANNTPTPAPSAPTQYGPPVPTATSTATVPMYGSGVPTAPPTNTSTPYAAATATETPQPIPSAYPSATASPSPTPFSTESPEVYIPDIEPATFPDPDFPVTESSPMEAAASESESEIPFGTSVGTESGWVGMDLRGDDFILIEQNGGEQ